MEGGGFDPNDQVSTNEEETKVVQTSDSMVPVTILQINNALNSTEKSNQIIIDGVERKHVSIVGMITAVHEENITLVYEVDDGTGQFSVQAYPSQEDSLEPAYDINTYVYVVGRIRPKKADDSAPPFLSAFFVKPVTDPNQIAFHNLQALYVHLFYLKGFPQHSAYQSTISNQSSANNGSGGSGTNNSAPQRNAPSTISDEEFCKQAIINFLKKKDSTYGAHINEIKGTLASKFDPDLIERSIEALSYNGEIYNSSEADHYTLC